MTIEHINDTFLGLPPERCTFDESAVVLIPAPYDGTTSYAPGARGGPAAIVAASAQLEPYDAELGREPAAAGVHTTPSFLPSAAGPEAVIGQVEQLCEGALAQDKFVVVVGGEHTVTLGAARAHARRRDELSWLQIDAHLDLRQSYAGTRFSHACVARRLLELGDGPLVHVGARVAAEEELVAARELGLEPLWAAELARQPRAEWIGRAVERLGDEVYVTVDVDGLDPSIIPATGTPVPGGLGWYDTLALLREVGRRRRVVGCDLVELAPGDHGHDRRSAFAAATLLHKMIGYFVPPA